MYKDVVNELLEFMEDTGKSGQQIAKEVGVSSATVSQFLNQKYRGDNDELARKVTNYLKLAKKRSAANKHTCFYEGMENTRKVLFACNYAHTRNDITLVFGDAGAGKTTALEHYRKINPGVVMVTANSCTASATAILNMICRQTGKSISGRKDILMDALVNYFKGTNRLIIIDEADHLTLTALQAVRNLNDNAGVGIVLAGNNKIYNQMLTGSRSSELQQLRTRIIVRRRVENNYTIDEFRQVFPDTDDECIGFLMELAQAESLRTAVKILEILYDYGEKITFANLKKIKRQLTEGL